MSGQITRSPPLRFPVICHLRCDFVDETSAVVRASLFVTRISHRWVKIWTVLTVINTEVVVKRLQSLCDLTPYVDISPSETGSHSDGVLKCLTANSA